MKMNSLIKKYDTEDQFRVLIDTYKQVENAWKGEVDIKDEFTSGINNIVVAGMGGSAIGADLLNNFLNEELRIPLIPLRNYVLPEFVNMNSLVIIASYSGNTEESISCLNDALNKNCKIAALSTGGEVQELADENNLVWMRITEGFQPRFALGASFFALLKLLQSLKIIPNQNHKVKNIIDLWKRKGIEYSSDDNEAFKLAESLAGFIPIIYSSVDFESVGYRLKCQFNENSKLLAFNNVYPELNHNEIIGWETFTDKILNAKIISIVDSDYHPQILKRIEMTNELITKSGAEIITLKSNEENIKVRIMDLIYLGDWITYYLAIIRAYDPSEIDYIMEIKKRLSNH